LVVGEPDGQAGGHGRGSLSGEEVAVTPDRVWAVIALQGAEQISCIIAVAPDSIESIVRRTKERLSGQSTHAMTRTRGSKKPRSKMLRDKKQRSKACEGRGQDKREENRWMHI